MIWLRSPVVIAALSCAVLPFALLAGGLTLTSATDVVLFAVACMALNILVGHTGLVSFGHGAWFGLGAYAVALAQRHWFAGSVVWPTLFALAFLIVSSILVGFLVLRRRGVYFSLLTLAFAALTYAVAYRWTAFTGGENGLGGVTRATWLGVDLENPWVYYVLIASLGVGCVYALSRFHASPIGTVLLAIRENDNATAQAAIGKAITLAPSDPAILFEAGHVAHVLGDDDKARRVEPVAGLIGIDEGGRAPGPGRSDRSGGRRGGAVEEVGGQRERAEEVESGWGDWDVGGRRMRRGHQFWCETSWE